MTSSALKVRCPAKINWVLRILGRREDGFHEVVTVLQAVDLWDELEISQSDNLELTCDDPTIPTDSRNLVLKAAAALASFAVGSVPGARIDLRKRIPAGGGLGGGSSNAAGALAGLSAFWNLGLGRDELAAIASSLGADVPFFLYGGTAVGTGKGDQVEAIPFAGKKTLLLGFPPVQISTAEVYRRLGANLTLQGNDVNLPGLRGLKLRENKDFGFAVNDLESVVFSGWSDLKRFRDALLEQGGQHAMLSGSGSTVLGVFSDAESMKRAVRQLAGRFKEWRLFETRTIREAIQLIV
jgi:4-diphosphocytidyl-2-C-methyl-D-erythritol kinase